MSEKLKIGAVIYAPQVTVIWGIIADFFEKEGFPIEPVYFKDYKGQVDALLNNEIDVATDDDNNNAPSEIELSDEVVRKRLESSKLFSCK